MRYLMTLSYDGSNYNGYQKQPNEKTIQNEIEKVLTVINSNKKVTISASGRTDAGVHALNQKAHFDLDKEIDVNKLRHSINSLLPNDIYVKDIVVVSTSFHARFNVKAKEYIYKINIGEYNPIQKDYIYQYNKDLDIKTIKEALIYIQGTHDFKSFVKADVDSNDYTRTIINTNITIEDEIVTISFTGTGFMRYMVRNMVGYLIEIGQGKHTINDLKQVLELKDRTKAGITAPPVGLYLKDVFY